VIPRQSPLSLAVKEAFPLAIIAIVLVMGFVELRQVADAKRRPYIVRTAAGLVLVIVASVANVLLGAGRELGLEILALCCLLFLAWMVFNAFALIIGLADETGQQPD
jgi:hypothetical protein